MESTQTTQRRVRYQFEIFCMKVIDGERCDYFIDRCPDKVLLEKVKKSLIPIQMCEAEAQPIYSPSMGEVVAYLMRPTTGGEDK